MSDQFVTIVVSAAEAPAARAVAAAVPGGSGMFEVGLSKSGKEPATHFISSGLVSDELAAMFPEGTDEEAAAALERLGLKLIEGE